jgi:hypothetical protein
MLNIAALLIAQSMLSTFTFLLNSFRTASYSLSLHRAVLLLVLHMACTKLPVLTHVDHAHAFI